MPRVPDIFSFGDQFVRKHDPDGSINPSLEQVREKSTTEVWDIPGNIYIFVLVEKDVPRIMEYLNMSFPQLADFFKIALVIQGAGRQNCTRLAGRTAQGMNWKI